MKRALAWSLGAALTLLTVARADAEPVKPLPGRPVKFHGPITSAKNLSGLGVVGEFLIVGVDDQERLTLLRRQGPAYSVVGAVALGKPDEDLDIEGIACSGGSACSSGSNKGSHVLGALYPDVTGANIRFSFSRYTTKEEIDRTVEVLKRVCEPVTAGARVNA